MGFVFPIPPEHTLALVQMVVEHGRGTLGEQGA